MVRSGDRSWLRKRAEYLRKMAARDSHHRESRNLLRIADGFDKLDALLMRARTAGRNR